MASERADSVARYAAAIGAVLVVLGGAGVAVGGIQAAAASCDSGQSLYVSTTEGTDSTDPVAFEELSPVEQRIFLEAVTDENDVSRDYDEWSSWFERVDAVTYRGQTYEVTRIHSDCVPGFGRVFLFFGLPVVFAGLWLFVPAYFWRRYSG